MAIDVATNVRERASLRAARVAIRHTCEFALNRAGARRTIYFAMSRESERRLREARDAAQLASERKSEFLSSVSHEIRTPLNTVLGMAELLADTDLDDAQRHYVRTLQRAGDHLLALVDEVLDLTRIESGSVNIEHHAFDVHELAESAIEIVRVGARRKKLELACAVAPDAPRVLDGDARRLRQVLVNLLGNAVKFTSAGRIALGVACEETADEHATLHFTVRDTGIGIPPNRLSAIFSEFIQADPSIAKRYGGYGLGLDIAKRIVERMGGTIWAESELGRGSCFHVTVPFAISRRIAPAPTESRSGSGLRLVGRAGPLRVLVVDDSEDNRMLLGEFLRSAGVLVSFADDGASALAIGTTEPFDIVLMDLQMPELDGYETTRELIRIAREKGREPPPIVALSAHALQSSLERSAAAGCVQQLTKPIRKRVLLEAVARITRSTLCDASTSDDLSALIPQFLANRRNDVRAIGAALERDDFDTIAMLAHNMRGTGTSFGFPAVTAIGEALEHAARERRATACRDLLARLDDTLAVGAASRRTASGPRARVDVLDRERRRGS